MIIEKKIKIGVPAHSNSKKKTNLTGQNSTKKMYSILRNKLEQANTEYSNNNKIKKHTNII